MTDRPGSPASRLAGRVAVVTGGGSGIGRAACERLALEGSRLAVVDLHAERAEETAKRLGREASADAFAMGLDVRSEEDMDAMVSRTLERFGRIDVLVHAAGILHPPGSRPRLLVVGDVLTQTTKVASLETRKSPSLGVMVVVTRETTYRDRSGQVVAIQRSQLLHY